MVIEQDLSRLGGAKPEEIACGADSAKIIDSYPLQVSPFDSVQAYNSEITYLGLDTDYIHAVGVDSEVIGHKAEHVAVADVNATIVGYQTRGSVIAANTDAEEIGDETNGAVYISDGDTDRVTEPQPYFRNQTKMQSPIKQYSTWHAEHGKH